MKQSFLKAFAILAGGIALFSASPVLAAPTSTIVQNLIINSVKNATCLLTDSNGLVAAASCGTNATTTINGVQGPIFTFISGTGISISTSTGQLTFTNTGLLPANNLSDVQSSSTAINNILPDQTNTHGKVLGSVNSLAAWVDPPTPGSATFYAWNSSSSVATFKQLEFTPTSTANTFTTNSVASGTVFAKYMTDVGALNFSFIPAGVYLCHMHLSSPGNPAVACQFWEQTSAGADVALIGQTSFTAPLTGTDTEYIEEFANANVYTLASTTSRISVRLISRASTSDISVYTGGATDDTHIELPGQTINASNYCAQGAACNPSTLTASGNIVTTGGSLGVGTSTPATNLQVYGTTPIIALTDSTGKMFRLRNGVAAANVFDIYDNSSSTSRLAIGSNGNVGIGTTAPAEKLEVIGNIRMQNVETDATNKITSILGGQYTNANAPYVGMRLTGSNGANTAMFGGGDSSYNAATQFRLYTAANTTTVAGSQRMIAFNDGSMGFGGTQTGGTLTGASLVIDNTGNVGIGTTTPANALTVNGNIAITSSTGGMIFPDATRQTTAPIRDYTWSGIFSTSTNTYDDNFIGTVSATSTIDSVQVASKDSSNTMSWNLFYGTDPTGASSTLFKVFSSDQTTTSTVGSVRTLTPTASSTPGANMFMRLYVYNASTTYTNFTIHTH